MTGTAKRPPTYRNPAHGHNRRTPILTTTQHHVYNRRSHDGFPAAADLGHGSPRDLGAPRRARHRDRRGRPNCAPVNDRYTQFDDFLAREVPLIEASPAFGNNGVIVVLYDEDERMGGLASHNGLGEGGHTVCAVLSPLVTPGEYTVQTYSYSVLRTLQDGFDVSPYLGAAVDVGPLPVIWR